MQLVMVGRVNNPFFRSRCMSVRSAGELNTKLLKVARILHNMELVIKKHMLRIQLVLKLLHVCVCVGSLRNCALRFHKNEHPNSKVCLFHCVSLRFLSKRTPNLETIFGKKRLDLIRRGPTLLDGWCLTYLYMLVYLFYVPPRVLFSFTWPSSTVRIMQCFKALTNCDKNSKFCQLS